MISCVSLLKRLNGRGGKAKEEEKDEVVVQEEVEAGVVAVGA